MSDDEEETYEHLKVALKPRCNLGGTTSEILSNQGIDSVELNIWKQFIEQAVESELEALFDALGQLESLKKLTIASKGSAIQTLPVYMLAHTIGQASGLEELYLQHIKLSGHSGEFEDFADAFGEHPSLKVIDIHVENMDVMEKPIAAAAQIPSLQVVSIETAVAPLKSESLAAALESLCTSKSLKKLSLINMASRYEDLSEMTTLLGINQVLEELTIKVTKLDADGGKSIVNMLLARPALKKLSLQMDTMDKGLTPEFVKALDHNPNLEYFQLLMDGRMSDMKVARTMVVAFRDGLKGKFKATSKVGMHLGVTCERIAIAPPDADE